MVSRIEIVKAIEEFDPSLEIENIRDISGENRETYDVKVSSDENFICCFNKDKPEWFKKEEKLIELVNEKTNVPTQKILHSNFSADEISKMFHVAEKIDGIKSEESYADLSLEEKEELVRQIGRYLAELHKKVQFESFGRLRYRNGSLKVEEYTWKELVQEIAEGYIQGMKDTRFEDLQEKMRNYVEKNLHLLNESHPVLVHYDVAADNIVRQGTDIKAILDWERAFVGQPEWDLAHSEVRFILQFLEDDESIQRLKEAFYDSYQKVRGLEVGWKTRKEYYEMIQLFHGMKYFENWTDRKSYSKEEKKKEEDWHREHFKKNNKKLSY